MSRKNNSRAKNSEDKSNDQPNNNNNSESLFCFDCQTLIDNDMSVGLILNQGEIVGVVCANCFESDVASVRFDVPIKYLHFKNNV